MRARSTIAASLAVIASGSSSAQADVPVPPPTRRELVFVAGPGFGMEGGARTVRSIGHVLFAYEDALPRLALDESTPLEKGTAVVGRALELLFLDAPMADMETAVVHEVFGHGARAREFGAHPTYTFRLPLVYGLILSPNDPNLGVVGEYGSVALPPEEDLLVRLGGAESGYVMAWWIDAEAAAAHGWVHHDDLLVYAAAKLMYVTTLFDSTIETQNLGHEDDMAAYVSDLQLRFGRYTAEDRREIVGRLRAAYAWNLADPTLLYAIYGTLVDSLWKGRAFSRLPLPSIDGTTFYATPRFAFTPFGAEHYLDVFLARGTVLVDAYGRIGSSGLASYSGAGVRVLGWTPVRVLSLGGEADVWAQPDALPGGWNVLGWQPPPPTDEPGANVGLFARVAISDQVGITGKLACKTRGFLMGQPYGSGPYGYIGLSIRP